MILMFFYKAIIKMGIWEMVKRIGRWILRVGEKVGKKLGKERIIFYTVFALATTLQSCEDEIIVIGKGNVVWDPVKEEGPQPKNPDTQEAPTESEIEQMIQQAEKEYSQMCDQAKKEDIERIKLELATYYNNYLKEAIDLYEKAKRQEEPEKSKTLKEAKEILEEWKIILEIVRDWLLLQE